MRDLHRRVSVTPFGAKELVPAGTQGIVGLTNLK